MCTKAQAITILGEVYNECSNIFDSVHDAYLYGSYARGDYTNESDVDILVTANLSREQISSQRMKLASVTSNLSLKHNVTVSLTVKPLEHFNRYLSVLPYYKNVVSEGIRYEA
ncbi:MAG: nucleotidyltransferase domain-containing protein [Clostridia bacterium]|nr:nucleotidyltransferase domain-containing protein [Clostridia bacterium]